MDERRLCGPTLDSTCSKPFFSVVIDSIRCAALDSYFCCDCNLRGESVDEGTLHRSLLAEAWHEPQFWRLDHFFSQQSQEFPICQRVVKVLRSRRLPQRCGNTASGSIKEFEMYFATRSTQMTDLDKH